MECAAARKVGKNLHDFIIPLRMDGLRHDDRRLNPNSEIGMVAHAARVPVWAARRNLRLTFFVRFWREKVCWTRFSASAENRSPAACAPRSAISRHRSFLKRFFTTDGHGFTRIGKRGAPGLPELANYRQLIFASIREIRVTPLSVFIRVHPWLRKKLCGSLRPRRLCVEGLSVGLRFRRAGSIRVHPWLKKKLCGSLRPRRLCVEGLSVGLRFRRAVFIRVHPWLKKKLCGSLRPRRLCVEGLSVGLRFRRAVFIRVHPWLKKKFCGSLRTRRLALKALPLGRGSAALCDCAAFDFECGIQVNWNCHIPRVLGLSNALAPGRFAYFKNHLVARSVLDCTLAVLLAVLE